MGLENTNWKSARETIRERNITLKTKDPIVRGGFTQVPNHILKSNDLTVGEKLTFAMFLSYAWNNDFCFPGQEKLAKDLGAGERSVRRFIAGLERKGFLVVKQRGLGKTNLYTLKFNVKKQANRPFQTGQIGRSRAARMAS